MQENTEFQPEKVNDTLARFYQWVQHCNQKSVLTQILHRMNWKKQSEKTPEIFHAR